MSVDYTAPSFSGGTPSGIALTNAFADIEEVLKDAVSRTGTTPNAMEADLDLNGYDLLNVGGLGGRLLTAEDINGLQGTVGTLDSRSAFNLALIRRNEEEIDALDQRVSSLQNIDIVEDLGARLSSLETSEDIQNDGLQNVNIRISEVQDSLGFINPKLDGVQRFLGEIDPATQTFPIANKGDVVVMTGDGQLSTRTVEAGQAWRAQFTTAADIGNNWVRHPSDDIIEPATGGDTGSIVSSEVHDFNTLASPFVKTESPFTGAYIVGTTSFTYAYDEARDAFISLGAEVGDTATYRTPLGKHWLFTLHDNNTVTAIEPKLDYYYQGSDALTRALDETVVGAGLQWTETDQTGRYPRVSKVATEDSSGDTVISTQFAYERSGAAAGVRTELFQRGAIHAADYANGALFDSSTPNENRAALQDVINRAATTSGINKLILPYGADMLVNGRLDIPENLEIDLNSSILRPVHPTLIDFMVVNGSNVEMYGGQIEVEEGVLQRMIRIVDQADDVYLHNISGVGDAGIDPVTGLEDTRSSVIALVNTGDGRGIQLDNLTANNIENLADVNGSQQITINNPRGTMMSGATIWYSDATRGLYINNLQFNWHTLGRGINNAIGGKGQTNSARKEHVYIKGGLLQGRPGVSHDSEIQNGASGDLIAIRDTSNWAIDGTTILDSGEYSADGVHGSSGGRITNCYMARANVCHITVGSFTDGTGTQSPTLDTIVGGNILEDAGLNHDGTLDSATIPAIRVYNTDRTSILPNHIKNAAIGIGYRDALNTVAHDQTMINVDTVKTAIGTNSFKLPQGASFGTTSENRWEAGFSGAGALANNFPQSNVSQNAVVVSTGVYDVTFDVDTGADVLMAVRAISATQERKCTISRIDEKLFRVTVTDSSGAPRNTQFHIVIEDSKQRFDASPMQVDCAGAELDSPLFNSKLPDETTSSTGAVIDLSNYTVPAGVSARAQQRRWLGELIATDGSVTKEWSTSP